MQAYRREYKSVNWQINTHKVRLIVTTGKKDPFDKKYINCSGGFVLLIVSLVIYAKV